MSWSFGQERQFDHDRWLWLRRRRGYIGRALGRRLRKGFFPSGYVEVSLSLLLLVGSVDPVRLNCVRNLEVLLGFFLMKSKQLSR